MNVGDPAQMSFIIDNTANTLDADDLEFTDPLPAGLVFATPSNLSTDCSGSLAGSDPAGGSNLVFSGGVVAGGTMCKVAANVICTTPGTKLNTSSALHTSLGNVNPASASLDCVATQTGYSQWAAKVVCAEFATHSADTIGGLYRSVVNIHNPQADPVQFRYKVAIAITPGVDGPISPFTTATIGPDAVQAFGCSSIRTLANHFQPQFLDGFFVVEAPESLDISVVYAAGTDSSGVSSLEIEEVSERPVSGQF